MPHDPPRLSELFVLRVLAEQTGDSSRRRVSIEQLREKLAERLRPVRDAHPFTLGAHASFGEFLLELDAVGAISLADSGNKAVTLTKNGRDRLRSANRKGFASYRFA